MGFETEYQYSELDPSGCQCERDDSVTRFFRCARRLLTHLRGVGPDDLFLRTSHRLYRDCNDTIEMATPEVIDPWSAVRYLKAGHRLLAGVARHLEKREDVGEIVMGRCNVSYGTNATRGRHESYGFKGSTSVLAHQLLPFLASRVIFHGAGGLSNTAGIVFTLSPRSTHIVKDISGNSTGDRGLFHTKEESLSRGRWKRVHVLCGESQCSDFANWITAGTTALVVALVEAGGRPAKGVALEDPTGALHAFARDLSLKTVSAPLEGGGSTTALDLQRHYCEAVGKHLDAPTMPDWAEEIHRSWVELLDTFEQAPEHLTRKLDAPMKLAVFKKHALRRGFHWEEIDRWNHVASPLARTFVDRLEHPTGRGISRLIRSRATSDDLSTIKRFVQAHGLSFDRYVDFLDLKAELEETDTRWSQLGPKGIFNSIEANAPLALDHRVEGVGRVSKAMVTPPSGTRAALRGSYVRKLAARNPERFRVSWTSIVDTEDNRILDLAEDPFMTSVQWREFNGENDPLDVFCMPIEDIALGRRHLRITRLHETRRRLREQAEASRQAE